MKLIHTADLHLDSPIRSIGDFAKAAARRDEILHTFGRIVDLAIRESATAVLIAGDLFDSDCATDRAVRYVLEQIGRCPEIGFYCLRGNHDRSAFGDREGLPENLHLFDGTLRSCPLSDGVRLYASENPYALADADPFDPRFFNLAMLHGQPDDFAANLPDRTQALPIGRFARKNLDYLALGHIHARYDGRLDERGIYLNPGCPNGRGFDECGEKGVILLEIEDRRCAATFVPLSDRVYHDLSVDVGEISDGIGQLRAVQDAVAEIAGRDAVRLSLVGQKSPDQPAPDCRMIAESLRGRFFDFRVYDRTTVCVNLKQLEGEVSLRGEFLRLASAADLDEQERRLTVQYGLAALAGEEILP